MTTVWLFAYWAALAAECYILLGYPLALLVINLFIRRRNPASRDVMPAYWEPRVSLIIPAHNEAKVLRAKLENALALDYPPEKLEIILASDGSTDDTAEIARSFQTRGIKVFAHDTRRGKAAVVNDAVQCASGEVLFLCDANVIFAADALRRLAGHMKDPTVGAVTGAVRLASLESNFGHGESFYYRLERVLQSAESAVGSLIGVDGGMYLLRKEMFRPLPADTILDDFVISMGVLRQGCRVVYEPSAVAEENGTPAASQEWRRRVRVAAGAAQSLKRGCRPPLSRPVYLWQYLSHKLLRWLSPFYLLLLFAANAMLLGEGAWYRFTFFAQIGFCLLAAIALWVPFRKTPWGGIPFYFAMSNAALAVGLFNGLFDRQPVTWQQADRSRVAPAGKA